jgi:hypothetical protein
LSSGKVDKNGKYTVSIREKYTEPKVFEATYGGLLIMNYKFAYGNRMSDADDNPYTVLGESSSSSSSSSAGTSGDFAESSASPEFALD